MNNGNSSEVNHFLALDRRITGLEREVTGIVTSMRALHSDLNDLKTSQKELVETVNKRGQTNWSVLVSIIGVLGAGFMFYTTLLTEPLSERIEYRTSQSKDMVLRLEEDLKQYEQRLYDHMLEHNE